MLILLGWLFFRVLSESGPGTASALIACFSGVIVTAHVLVLNRLWVPAFALSGSLFVLASWLLGEMDPTGLRFQGISGNPNRMVFGLLVILPLLVAFAHRSRAFLVRSALYSTSAIAVWLVVRSGSEQGVVGLLVIVVAVCVYLTRRIELISVVGLIVGASVILTLWTLSSGLVGSMSDELLTLSGRTSTFAAGIQEFLQHPIIGTGNLHVTQGDVVDRSTHNTTIGIAAASGALGLTLWVFIIVRGFTSAFTSLRAANLVAVSSLAVLSSQLVQSVESVPLTWVMILLISAPTDGEGRARA